MCGSMSHSNFNTYGVSRLWTCELRRCRRGWLCGRNCQSDCFPRHPPPSRLNLNPRTIAEETSSNRGNPASRRQRAIWLRSVYAAEAHALTSCALPHLLPFRPIFAIKGTKRENGPAMFVPANEYHGSTWVCFLTSHDVFDTMPDSCRRLMHICQLLCPLGGFCRT